MVLLLCDLGICIVTLVDILSMASSPPTLDNRLASEAELHRELLTVVLSCMFSIISFCWSVIGMGKVLRGVRGHHAVVHASHVPAGSSECHSAPSATPVLSSAAAHPLKLPVRHQDQEVRHVLVGTLYLPEFSRPHAAWYESVLSLDDVLWMRSGPGT